MNATDELANWVLRLNQQCAEKDIKLIHLRAVLRRIASYERGGSSAREADEMIDLANEAVKDLA